MLVRQCAVCAAEASHEVNGVFTRQRTDRALVSLETYPKTYHISLNI